ncbi:DNA cytosine methyltransferase [Granulicella sibirica]|uniref:Cytosine-specific methyltransferase n=1 Tax=Granulicella sibirica TaxID=2479048 RepID=A0A4Q0SZL1_9BACT|nr:DNA cytosine methyltransferase [Granulicella sibirica]RXH56725.1 DNA-cytosine methyltransferase [Granulicella sibirica]
MPSFYEFFAGGGMARAGLGEGWTCLFANDFDHKKSHSYVANWGQKELKTEDVGALATTDLPGLADLVWASFPCQDLSLAGGGAGLQGNRSGTFKPFWKLMRSLIQEGRAPKVMVLENVCGAITSHGGKDFATICNQVEQAGYEVGALVVNASLFVPQSRPRLFIIGVRKDLAVPEELISLVPYSPWHTDTLSRAFAKLPSQTKRSWIWWNLPRPAERSTTFADLLEESADTPWFSPSETERLLGMMSPTNRAKVIRAVTEGKRMVGCIYKRTRPTQEGDKVQRAEVRFDDISGCLRTPSGGSSRQVVLVVEGKSIKARLISSRETARLMGLEESYKLPSNYNEAYHLTGDGVVVPVVRHLAARIFEPLLASRNQRSSAAA